MKRITFVATVTLITAFLSGCISDDAARPPLQPIGEMIISVKESELLKVYEEKVGWADVSIDALKALPHVECDDEGSETRPEEFFVNVLDKEHKVAKELPKYFCKDEKIRLRCYNDETTIVSLSAALKVPIAYRDVLEAKNIPNVMQFAVDRNTRGIDTFHTSAYDKYRMYADKIDEDINPHEYERQMNEYERQRTRQLLLRQSIFGLLWPFPPKPISKPKPIRMSNRERYANLLGSFLKLLQGMENLGDSKVKVKVKEDCDSGGRVILRNNLGRLRCEKFRRPIVDQAWQE